MSTLYMYELRVLYTWVAQLMLLITFSSCLRSSGFGSFMHHCNEMSFMTWFTWDFHMQIKFAEKRNISRIRVMIFKEKGRKQAGSAARV